MVGFNTSYRVFFLTVAKASFIVLTKILSLLASSSVNIQSFCEAKQAIGTKA